MKTHSEVWATVLAILHGLSFHAELCFLKISI